MARDTGYKEDLSKGKMLRFEDSLPKLPVPTLEGTAFHYPLQTSLQLLTPGQKPRSDTSSRCILSSAKASLRSRKRLSRTSSSPVEQARSCRSDSSHAVKTQMSRTGSTNGGITRLTLATVIPSYPTSPTSTHIAMTENEETLPSEQLLLLLLCSSSRSRLILASSSRNT